MAYYDLLDTPLGELFVGGSEAGLHRIDFTAPGRGPDELAEVLVEDAGEPAARDPEHASRAVSALRDYFEGRQLTFDLPLAPRGTPFQRAVWEAELSVPPGCTASYGEIAERIGKPGAARAVGAATGRNPLGVVVPCHRIVGSDGSLTGYGGGLDRKRWLLAHEASATAVGVAVA